MALTTAVFFPPVRDPGYSAHRDYYSDRQPRDPKPRSLRGYLRPSVRLAHVASELEVFWTGRGGSFALSFLALSLSARILLVFVLGGLG